MKQPFLLTTSFLLLLAAMTTNLQAAVVLYTDRSAWRTAAGGAVGDIIDDFNAGSTDRGSYTISGTVALTIPASSSGSTIDGSNHLRLDVLSSKFATFTFDVPIFSLGFDLKSMSISIRKTLDVTLDAATTTNYTLPDQSVFAEFRGFVSDTAFNSFTITAANAAYHGVDNLEAYSAAVPEPSRALLLVAGLGALLERRRRR